MSVGSTKKRELGRQKRKFRIRKKINGTAERPRLSVFRSAKHIVAQAIDDTAGVVVAYVSTQSKIYKEKNEGAYTGSVQAATQVGQLLAQLVKDKGVATVVFDKNGYRYHGRVKAVADAVRESGIKV